MSPPEGNFSSSLLFGSGLSVPWREKLENLGPHGLQSSTVTSWPPINPSVSAMTWRFSHNRCLLSFCSRWPQILYTVQSLILPCYGHSCRWSKINKNIIIIIIMLETPLILQQACVQVISSDPSQNGLGTIHGLTPDPTGVVWSGQIKSANDREAVLLGRSQPPKLEPSEFWVCAQWCRNKAWSLPTCPVVW